MIKTAAALTLLLAAMAASPAAAAENPACHWEGSFRVCGGKPKPILGPVKDITIRNPFYRNRDKAAAPTTAVAAAAPAVAPSAKGGAAALPVLAPSATTPTALSRQAGAMIAAGDCAGARAAVLNAGDLALAVQVDQLCRR